MTRIVAIVVLISSASVTHAHAYLDPGTGSMILQGIIGAIAVAGATVTLYWHRAKAFVRSVLHKSRPE